ncbi:TPA: hypothetical protein ACHJYD_001979 [Enterococcus faecalis]
MNIQNFVDFNLYLVVYETMAEDGLSIYIIFEDELEQDKLLDKIGENLKKVVNYEKIQEIIHWGHVQIKTSECASECEEKYKSLSKVMVFYNRDFYEEMSVYSVKFRTINRLEFSRIVALKECIVAVEDVITEIKNMYPNIQKVISIKEFK